MQCVSPVTNQNLEKENALIWCSYLEKCWSLGKKNFVIVKSIDLCKSFVQLLFKVIFYIFSIC